MLEQIKEQIHRLREDILIHSCIYYELNSSVVADSVWDEWAMALEKLQDKYGHEGVDRWDETFKGWTHHSGYHLPHRDKWVMKKAEAALYRYRKVNQI